MVNFLKMKEGIISCNENKAPVLWKSQVPCDEPREELLKDEANICGSILFLLEPTKRTNSLLGVTYLYL